MTTLHIWLDVPERDALMAKLETGDVVLDLSFTASSAPLREHIASHLPGVTWHTHDLLEMEVFERAREALLKEFTQLAQSPVSQGQSLRELFKIDGLSLWWLTPFSEKRLRTNPNLQIIYRRWWMVHAGGGEHLSAALKSQRTWTLWGKDASILTSWEAQLIAMCGAKPAAHVLDARSGDPLPGRDPVHTLRSRSPWNSLGKRLATLRRHVRLQHQWQQARPHIAHSQQDTELLIVTFASGWRRDANGAVRHTYFHDVAHAMHARGIRVTWLPIALMPSSATQLYEMMREQNLPVCWDALDVSMETLCALHTSVEPMRRKFELLVDELLGHDALHMFGIDMSPWLLADLAHLVDEDALKFLLLRHVVEQGVQSAKPAVLLYRDEFYALGRAISNARCADVPKWAMQHGLISEDHWTYLYTADDVQGVAPLPTPDKFLVYGDYTSALMTRWGLPQELLDHMGSLRHDVMIERAAQAARDGAQMERLVPEDRPVLVLCTQLIAQIPGWIVRLVLGLQRAHIQAHIAVKQHPFHRADALIEQTFAGLGWHDYSVHTQHLEHLLRQSDVALTENSTTGIEALIWGTPLICYNEPGRYESFPYVSGGGALDGSSVETMASSLQTVLDPAQASAIAQAGRAFLATHLHNMQAPALDTFERALRERVAHKDTKRSST